MLRRRRLLATAVSLAFGAFFFMPCQPVKSLFSTRRELAISDLSTYELALEYYATDHDGEYPAALSALIEPHDDGFTYLKALTLIPDPWERPYIYERKAGGRGWRLICYGADGKPGGSGEARDLLVESK